MRWFGVLVVACLSCACVEPPAPDEAETRRVEGSPWEDVDCSMLDVDTCAAERRCQPILGARIAGECRREEPAGCFEYDRNCLNNGAAVRSPEGECWHLSFGCIPESWGIGQEPMEDPECAAAMAGAPVCE